MERISITSRDGVRITFNAQKTLEALYRSLEDVKYSSWILDGLICDCFEFSMDDMDLPNDRELLTTLDIGAACTSLVRTGQQQELEKPIDMEISKEMDSLLPGFRSEADEAHAMLDAMELSGSARRFLKQILFRYLSEDGRIDVTELRNLIDYYQKEKKLRAKLRRIVCRRIIRRIRNCIKIFLKGLWQDRISTASRSNANATDKMLLTIPTPPTDDYDCSYQWGGGMIGCTC